MIRSEIRKEETQSEAAWYVVQSEPNRERVAKYYLEGAGFQVYLPMRLCSPKSKAVMTPLFPRYLFVQLDLTSGSWPRVFSTIGVAAVMTHTTAKGSRPTPVPARFVDGIREREIDGVLHLSGQHRKGPALPFKPGDKVKVTCGNSFAELDAILLERVDANRVLVLLSLLSREWRVPVQVQSLKGS